VTYDYVTLKGEGGCDPKHLRFSISMTVQTVAMAQILCSMECVLVKYVLVRYSSNILCHEENIL